MDEIIHKAKQLGQDPKMVLSLIEYFYEDFNSAIMGFGTIPYVTNEHNTIYLESNTPNEHYFMRVTYDGEINTHLKIRRNGKVINNSLGMGKDVIKQLRTLNTYKLN